jgi:phage baseplate assembly protein W
MNTRTLSSKSSESLRNVTRSIPFIDFDIRMKAHPNHGDITNLVDIDAIRYSVRHILATSYNTKPFQPEFGSSVSQYLFENDGPFIRYLMESEITNSINALEPRVRVSSIDLEMDATGNSYNINLNLTIVQTGVDISLPISLERTR